MTGDTVDLLVHPGGILRGRVQVPGDKSISHRAVMLGAIADGITEVSGFLNGADCMATIAAFRALGVRIEQQSATTLRIHGVGLHGLQPAHAPLYLGNSGTSMRLLAGLLAGQHFSSTLEGDVSLSRRPMRRIVDPLRAMGARVDMTATGTAPLRVSPVATLTGAHYDMPVSSAQVKSCLLLAGLYADGTTSVHDPGTSRDHTERMLRALRIQLETDGQTVRLAGGQSPQATRIEIPADISSAAFFLVGAAIAPGSDLWLLGVGVNPTRAGILTILRNMGADIEFAHERQQGGEPVADLHVCGSRPLRGTVIDRGLVTLAIDEMPALFIAAACANGTTTISGAEELRVKESDRIATMCDGLRRLGANFEEQPDGATIQGCRLHGGEILANDDHRVAMAFAMAGLCSDTDIRIKGSENIATSFPDFVDLACTTGLNIRKL